MTTQAPGAATQTSSESVRIDGAEATSGRIGAPGAPAALATGYVAAWAVLGAISAGYLAVTAWDSSSRGYGARADLPAKIEQIGGDVAELKAQVADLTKSTQDDRARLTALETTVETRLTGLAGSAAKVAALAEPAPAVATQPSGTTKTVTVPGVLMTTTPVNPTPAAAPVAAAAPASEASATTETKAASSQPRAPTRIIAAAPPSDAAATKSADVAQAAKAAAKQKVEAKASDAFKPFRTTTSGGAQIETGSLQSRPSAGPVGVEVASAVSLESARQSWGGIASRAGDALAGTEPRIMPSVDGTSFRVIAGPYQSEADAQKTCAALKARGIACRSTGFGGAPL
ncbi:MAG TPA: SPOR domain-containing protein [Hyphomicrobiaceae bacterium]|nr:SPOR domain-containing protein [Hyphomicrobiaceae bacterium]